MMQELREAAMPFPEAVLMITQKVIGLEVINQLLPKGFGTTYTTAL